MTAGAACCEHDDDDGAAETTQPWWRARMIRIPLLSGLLLAVGFVCEWNGADVMALLLFWAALLAGASRFVPGAVRRLVNGKLGIGLLMTISATGAVILGYVEEAAALAFLYSIAEALEDRAMDKAKAGLRALLAMVPDTATVIADGERREIRAGELRAGQTILVRPGERVPTDGVVREGTSGVDTSAVTGEPIPADVTVGDPISAGSINLSGSLLIEASADGDDNSLTAIVALVEQAQREKGERARLADRIARPLVPGVVLLAVAVALIGSLFGSAEEWITRALVVLVAASPCALAIAVPVTVVSAIGRASTFGVVIKSGAAFERLGSIRHVAFDKTGTLTRNQPSVIEVVAAAGREEGEILRRAASLEAHSTHPLASAVVSAADRTAHATGVSERPGVGLTGTVDGSDVSVGSTRWLATGVLHADAERLERDGMTVVVVHIDGVPAGLIGIRDELRPEAPEAVAALHAKGLGTTLLTGDNDGTAAVLAKAAGISDVRARLRPEDKARMVSELSAGRPTAMIGDGINDAPALAAADIGIAMGTTGSDAAIESADVAFTGHDLRLIPDALAHARRGRRIMNQNVVLSLLIIASLLPLSLTGVLGLAAVVLVHEVAEVVVILNGLRAGRRRAGDARRRTPVRMPSPNVDMEGATAT
nr:cation-translocating P-type ATPase [Phytoactinopolyspora mesophila]